MVVAGALAAVVNLRQVALGVVVVAALAEGVEALRAEFAQALGDEAALGVVAVFADELVAVAAADFAAQGVGFDAGFEIMSAATISDLSSCLFGDWFFWMSCLFSFVLVCSPKVSRL